LSCAGSLPRATSSKSNRGLNHASRAALARLCSIAPCDGRRRGRGQAFRARGDGERRGAPHGGPAHRHGCDRRSSQGQDARSIAQGGCRCDRRGQFRRRREARGRRRHPCSQGPANWLAYAYVAIKADDAKADGRYELVTRGATAAYAAYLRSTTADAQAAALAVLADLLARHEQWRPALDALKASLDRFRILDYKVDSESASPRVCFSFSEPLVLRQGLPSAVGEQLLKSADYEIYVRDRSPQAHFAGRAYVLPRQGQKGATIWRRTRVKEDDYQSLPIEEKESWRWIATALKATTFLSTAALVTLIADREADIYELFARVPDGHTHVLVRAVRDRALSGVAGRMLAKIAAEPEAGRLTFDLTARPGRTARQVTLAVRFCPVTGARRRPARSAASLALSRRGARDRPAAFRRADRVASVDHA
jgi:hypothetical protein